MFNQQSKLQIKENIALPGDPLPYNSPFYIERPPIESDSYRELLKPGSLVRIKAPRRMGKSSLMLRLTNQAEEKGYSTAIIDFKLADSQTCLSLNNFLRWFCVNVARQLSIAPNINEYWDEDIGSKMSASIYFEEYLFEEINSPLVLVLNEVDYIFQYQQIAEDFLLLLRSWHEQAKQTHIWQKLRILIFHSTEVYIPLNMNQSPFNVGLSFKLPEFTVEQVIEFARRHELDCFHSQAMEKLAVEKLMHLLQGHPYLIHHALYYLQQQKISLQELLNNNIINNSIYSGYLRGLLTILQKDPELSQAYYQIVNFGNEKINLSANLVYKLDSLGLVRFNGDYCQPFCEMYRLFFQKNLLIENDNIEIQINQIKKENEKLQLLANIDQLTQVPNRRYFDDSLILEWKRMADIKEPLSLILLDVDRFKLYNDTYGHQAGDDCLRQVAQAINSVIKISNNLIARYGGEEFALILPQTQAIEAIIIAEEIRETVKSLRIKIPVLNQKTQLTNITTVTISLGIASIIPSEACSITEFFAAADQAMYQAKQLGRDRTIVSSKFKFGYIYQDNREQEINFLCQS